MNTEGHGEPRRSGLQREAILQRECPEWQAMKLNLFSLLALNLVRASHEAAVSYSVRVKNQSQRCGVGRAQSTLQVWGGQSTPAGNRKNACLVAGSSHDLRFALK